MAQDTGTVAKKRRRRWPIVVGGIVGIIGLLVLLVPSLAGAVAPGVVASRLKGRFPGTVDVGSVSLGWFSSQRVGPVVLRDERGKDVARVTIRVDRGLGGLARAGLSGGGDFGTIVIEGKADVVRGADGVTNVERALGLGTTRATPGPSTGAPAPSGGAPRVPAGLRVAIRLDRFDATYVDEGATPPSRASLDQLAGTVEVRVGGPITADLHAGASAGDVKGGTIAIKAKIDGWTEADGRLTPDKAGVDTTVAIKDLPTALLDAVAGTPLRAALDTKATLAESLGPALNLDLTAKGTSGDVAATIDMTLANARAKGRARYASSRLTLDEPLDASIRGSAIEKLVPKVRGSLAGQDDVTLAAVPDVALRVDALDGKLSTGGGALDLRGWKVSASVATGSATGTVRVEPGAAPKSFEVAGLSLRVESPDLAGGATVKGGTRAKIGGEPAGDIDVDLSLAGLLDASGTPRGGMPGRVAGRVGVKGVATALAQPFVRDLGLDLARDVGPTLDVEVVASATGEGVKAGAIPPTDLDLSARAQKLSADAKLRVSEDRIVTRHGGVRAELANAGAIAGLFVPKEGGWRITPRGTMVVLASVVDVPLVGRAPDLSRATLDGRADFKDWTVSKTDAAGVGPIEAKSVGVGFKCAPGVTPEVGMAAIMEHGGTPFYAQGSLTIANLFRAGVKPGENPLNTDPGTLRPVGKLDLQRIPTAFSRLFVPPPAPGEEDLNRLLAEVVGAESTLGLETKERSGGNGIDVAVRVQTPTTSVAASADVATSALTVRGLDARVGVSPAAFGALLAFASSEPLPIGKPRLVEPTTATVTLDPGSPLVVPLGPGFVPEVEKASRAKLGVALARTLIAGLELKDEKGVVTPLNEVGVERLAIAAEVSPGSLAGLARVADPSARARVEASFLGNGRQVLGELTASARTDLVGAKPVGPIEVEGALRDVATRVASGMLPPEMLDRAMLPALAGEKVTLSWKATMTPPPVGKDGAVDYASMPIAGEVTVSGERIATGSPVRFEVRPDRIALAAPATIALTPDPAWVNGSILAPKPEGGKDAKAGVSLHLTAPARVEVGVRSLAIARASAGSAPGSAGPLRPGVFALAAEATIPTLAMASAENVPLTIRDFKVTAEHPASAGEGTIEARVTGSALGSDGKAAPMRLDATVANLADARGVVDATRARVTATGELPAFPTGLIDALANQKGFLVELLGPTVDARLNATGVTLAKAEGGSAAEAPVEVSLHSARASASVKGVVRDGVFVSTQTSEVTLREVTPGLGAKVNRAVPLVASLEKTPADRPASVRITGLSIPLGEDVTKLSGEFAIDPGEARFGTSTVFGSLLKIVRQKTEGTVGTRLTPLTITVREGMLTFPKYSIPLGEFTLVTEGRVDLSKQTIDVVTWAPFGALADDFAGRVRLNTGLGGAVGRVLPIESVTMIPFRTRGTYEKSKTELDSELMLKSLGEGVSPEKLIETIPDLLKGRREKKKE